MKLHVVIHEADEGGYWAEVPALPGCFTQGETLDEVNKNIIEAIECHLDQTVPTQLPEKTQVIEVEV